jgi:manganese/zinc/iron transport system permease protein
MDSLTPTGLDLPTLGEVARVLAFRSGYNTSVVLLGVTLLGVAAGVVGTFAMLRKRALMSDALSHASLPGIAVAFLAATALGQGGRNLWLLLAGAAASGIVGVLTVQFIVRQTRLPIDAAMGAVLSVFFGLGFVLLSYIQTLETGDQGGIAKFIYGQTATMTSLEATSIGVVALAAALATAALFKEFRLVSFDPEFAEAQGWSITRVDLLMMALVVAVTVIGLRAVGLILVIALIIIPPAAARFWTERLGAMTFLSALFGGLSGYLGAAASALFPRFPAGAVIVLVAGCLFLLSLLLAPARGVLAASLRQARLRLDVASQHVLRAIYEVVERGHQASLDAPVDLRRLRPLRSWPRPWLAAIVRLLAWRGLLRAQGTGVVLTESGRAHALRITRNHRLWEQFLVTYADLAPSHVDHSADLVEHILSPDMVAELERELAAAGRMPRRLGVPPSVHPLGDGAAVEAGARA